jgi:hypothetical protein
MRTFVYLLVFLAPLSQPFGAPLGKDGFYVTRSADGDGYRQLGGYIDVPPGVQPDTCYVCLMVEDKCLARWFVDIASRRILFEFTLRDDQFSRARLELADYPLKSLARFSNTPMYNVPSGSVLAQVKIGGIHVRSP